MKWLPMKLEMDPSLIKYYPEQECTETDLAHDVLSLNINQLFFQLIWSTMAEIFKMEQAASLGYSLL